VKAVYLNKKEAMKRLREVSGEALSSFPEIREIRLFGSLAKGEETGLSDADIFILTESREKNPIERIRPYFNFFSDRLDIAVDMLAASDDEMESFEELLKGSVVLGRRE
jgi:predicted nucleotidyltransferase